MIPLLQRLIKALEESGPLPQNVGANNQLPPGVSMSQGQFGQNGVQPLGVIPAGMVPQGGVYGGMQQQQHGFNAGISSIINSFITFSSI